MYDIGFDPMANAAISIPSMRRCGSFSMISRSLNVPGSDSSALHSSHVGFGAFFGTKLHLLPVGNPAPPRPRRSESFTSWMIWSGVIFNAFSAALYPPPSMYTSIDVEFGLSMFAVSTLIGSMSLQLRQERIHLRHVHVLVV